MVRSSRVIWVAPLIALPFACATELEPGLEGPFDASFASSSGGKAGDVGSGQGGELPLASGGAEGLGGSFDFGSGGDEGSGGMMECAPTQKRCGGICIDPAPLVGCSTSGCAPCPAPPDTAIAVCNGDQCGIECIDGYTLMNDTCVQEAGQGGAAGAFNPSGGPGGRAEGAGGRATGAGNRPGTGSCNVASCTGCSVVGPFGCCRNNGTCGCTWVPGGYCL